LAESHCGFGRWYYGAGRQDFGDLSVFQELEGLHNDVHAQARKLLRAQDLGLPATDGIGPLIEARNRFVLGLHRLQEQVLIDLS
jgi:hypothetical protein